MHFLNIFFSCLQWTAVIYWDIFSPVNASLSVKSKFWEALCSFAVSTGSNKETEIYENICYWYNFRAEQRASCNLIGRAVPYMTLYKPFQAIYITFSRRGYLARHLCHLGK